MEPRIKVGLIIEGTGLETVDMREPEKGNPGMGGTQYCFLLLAFYLSKFYREIFDVSIISFVKLKLPYILTSCIIPSYDALKSIESELIILKTPNKEEVYAHLAMARDKKFITWSHNFLYANICHMVADTPSIISNVFVGKQMYDFYIDDRVIKKSTFIYNIVPDPLRDIKVKRSLPPSPIITFMGSLTKEKGFISLLKMWRIISKRYPDARLNVIGKGNLYNRKTKLGSLGIVDEETENRIRPLIIDKNGTIDSRIKFWGILGKEKYDIFLNSTVGIVNPTARTETFGLGIVEMACAQLPVVTRKWNGHLDTIKNGVTGFLGFSINSMCNEIGILIEDHELNYRMGIAAKENAKKFSPTQIMPEWKKLLLRIHNAEPLHEILKLDPPYWNNYKFLRGINSLFRNKFSLAFLPSIVDYETFGLRRFKSIKSLLKKVY